MQYQNQVLPFLFHSASSRNNPWPRWHSSRVHHWHLQVKLYNRRKWGHWLFSTNSDSKDCCHWQGQREKILLWADVSLIWGVSVVYADQYSVAMPSQTLVEIHNSYPQWAKFIAIDFLSFFVSFLGWYSHSPHTSNFEIKKLQLILNILPYMYII